MESFLCVWGYSFLQQFFNNHILQNNFPVVFGYIKREYLCNFRSKINEITTAGLNSTEWSLLLQQCAHKRLSFFRSLPSFSWMNFTLFRLLAANSIA